MNEYLARDGGGNVSKWSSALITEWMNSSQRCVVGVRMNRSASSVKCLERSGRLRVFDFLLMHSSIVSFDLCQAGKIIVQIHWVGMCEGYLQHSGYMI